jgi:ssRNA-specific RNase YbeY (16S rRNA maturation enzyme)
VELSGVLIHGILHLLGYNHEKSEIEAEKMKEKEEYYLLRLKT